MFPYQRLISILRHADLRNQCLNALDCVIARPDPNVFHLDEPALTAIRDAVNRGQPLGVERFREQVEAALGRRVGLRKQGCKAEPADTPLPGQLGLNL